MEQKEIIEKKNSEHVSSERKKAEKETPETKDSKNVASENKNMNKGTLDMGLSEEVASKTSDNRINSPSNVVKDRGKIQHDEESAAYSNIPLTQNKRELRETAKYRDAESYVNQHHHSIGEGLYMTDEILDLPPRFRTKVIQALENALVANNIKIDRNPLEYFTSYGDASKELDKNKDKLVYIPPNILEDARKSSEIKNDSAPILKPNLEKKSTDSNFYPSESKKPPFSSANLDSQVPSQNFRGKAGIKPNPPFPRTCNSNDYGARQKNFMGKYVHQPNVQKPQSRMLDHRQENVSAKTSSLPPKPFNNRSKFSSSISDSYVDTKTSVGNFQHDTNYATEGQQIIDFYQKTCNSIQPPSDVEMSFDCRYEEASDTNQANFKKDGKKKFSANKSTPYTDNNDYGKRISVDELFKQSKASSSSELNKIPEANVTVPCSDSRINVNSKPHDKKRTFPNSETQYENKKPFKSRSQYSAINSTSSHGNKPHSSCSESSKFSVNHTDSSPRSNTFAAESTKVVKSERKQFKPDTISDKSNTWGKNCESSNAQQIISKSPSYSGKDNFSKSKGIPSKHFDSDRDKKYENNSYSKNDPNKEKFSRNSGKIFNVPPEKAESNILQDLSLKNNSIQNRHRTRNSSQSSISSSYSSKSCDKVPRYNDTRSNMQDSSGNNVNSNRNSFEAFSHQGPMYKQFDKGKDFSKRSKNYRYSNRDKYSDSSSVLSDKSERTCNFSNNSVSDETCSQRNSKSFTKSFGKHFDGKRANNFFQNSKLSSRDQEISRRKHDSCFPQENHHHFNKTATEYEKENNSRVLSEKGFFVKVEISENVTDLEQWINYFSGVFQFPFELERCCHFSNVLILEFERKEHAFAGLDILYKEKRILQRLKKPHFLLISSLLNRLTKPCNCNKQVIRDCIGSIEKHFESSLCILFNKIEEVEQCKFTQKKYNSKKKFHSAESKILKSFEESTSNFANFKEETIRYVKTAENLREVQELKHLFIRECNTFKRCLPIYSKKSEILNLARFHSVSVIVAETGSGKSTQLVEYLLHSPISKSGLIICTQPRKLAAISIAQFVSGQIGSAIGKVVGYDVGIEKKYNDTETKIIYMTDYCLLKYFLRNRDLKNVSCIIIDEAHERSLYTDLILGLLKEHLKSSKKLSVLITSATINPAIFIDYFSMSEQCVIEVPGRTYPVDVVWFPEDVVIGWDYLDACVNQAYDIHVSQEEGDILVFLTSPSESEEAIYLFKRRLSKKDKKVELLSLHGKTDIQEQMQIFQKISKSSRKIIFATNVAETAVTIPGIKYVVDSGMTKELMFDPQKNKSYLTVTFTTKSAADQRKGRAGRTQSGICYRMYSKRNYTENMPDNAVPEILKSNLQRALLKIFELGIDPENFDFIEAPPARTISNSVESLEYLGAVANKKLTDFGKKLVKLPLEPQLSKLVLQGIEAKIGIEAIIIAALVSESGKLFIRNEENRAIADEKKRKFCHEGGDLCTFLEIYKKWKEVDIPKRYDWCVANFVSFKALYAAAKTVKEILITLRTELGLHVSSQYNNNDYKKQYEKIIFDSFSENLCVLSGHPKLGYLSPYLSESFFIHPSSTLSYMGKDSPEFLVYGTLMETSRNFLFDVTPISEATLKSAYQAGKFRLPLHTLRCLQVPPKIMGPFGESVLIRHILGKGGSKIKDLEKTLLQLTFVKNLYVDVDVVKGLITVYLSHRLHEKVENHIQQIINTALAEMLKEEDLVKLTGTSMYFALGAGGIINDIIMPGEFRELVFNRMQSKDSNELETLLQTYGPLQSFSHVTSKQEMQTCATFKKVCDAKRAFLDLKYKRKYDVSPKLHVSDVGNKSSPLHMLLISWCCRPSTGFGLVELFSEEDLIEASGILTCNSFYLGNNLVMFQVAEEKHTLSMKNLPEFVEESTIKEKLNEAIPHIKVKSIQIFRKNVKITDATVEDTKKKVSKLLSLYVSSSKFTVDLKYPKKDALWNAAVYFDSAVDAENTYMKLKDSTCIDSYPLSVRLIFKCQLYCKKNVFDMVSVHVNNILRERKAEGICDESSIKVLDGKTFNVKIEFSCMSLEDLYKTRQYLRQFLEGTYLPFMGNLKYHFLFTEGLAEQISKIQRSTKTKLNLDKIKKAISIYGPPDNCRKAEEEIYQLALNQDYSFTRTFNLKASCIPNGFLRDLYSKYGYDLHGLAVAFRLTVASIDNYGCTLTLKGSKEQIRKAERALEKMCEELFQSRGERQKAKNGEENCPICFDPVSFDFQRLEHCGHAFCRQCLLLQLESKTMPVVCVKQDCGKLIFLEDIKRIISFGDHLKKAFCAVALQYHVSCNVGKLSYCRTPDCQMVYRITKEGSEYNCPSCNNSTCTRCQSPYHYGMSCEMFQECQKNVDYSLKMWVKENESNRKSCPSCKVVIEKSEGCNHMECLNCKVHLCWLCLKIFPTGDKVYDHMPYCPKNQ